MTANEETPGGNRGSESDPTTTGEPDMTIIPPAAAGRQHAQPVTIPLPFDDQPAWAIETAEWPRVDGGFEYAFSSERISPIDEIVMNLEQVVTITRDSIVRQAPIIAVLVDDETELGLTVAQARAIARAFTTCAAHLERFEVTPVSDELVEFVKAADALRASKVVR